ncbi:MAG: ribonuclease III [Candidatus Gracilibacteria bacterium]|nr:ribonuclease III [Candidatus Gracilibacteria bacterium]
MIKKNSRFDYDEFKDSVTKLLSDLEIPYNDILLYIQSFVHKSVLNEKSTQFKESNERLEFFGDAVLELIVTEMLYFNYPEKSEGDLTDIRSAVVRGKNLAIVSSNLKFQNYVILSKGEILAGGNENPYILANTLEAFLGGLYIDLGYDKAKDFVKEHIFSTLSEIMENKLHIDPKSYLQEIVQSKYNVTPNYEVISESGMDHEKNYLIGVYFDEKKIGEGTGSSKKKAQKNAAENALENLSEWFN